ncbi:MAG: bifunctional metallophosphatase/5'-nucleotidase [Thermodesulfobacteriota bacterium]
MKRSRLIWSLLFFLFFTTFAYGQQAEIRILHINDFHGFAEPYKPLGSEEWLGGIPYLATKANELRKEKASLLLSAGDMIQGNNWANLFKGESVIKWMNEMRFDAMVVGNHEFDFGQEVLKKRIAEARFPILGANVEGLNSLKPYIIKELQGVKIAIIGVTTEDTPVSTHPKNVVGLKFLSPVDTVEKYIKKLRGQSDILIVLSHIGYSADRILAEKVKGIDVIVGGHSHTRINEPVRVGDAIIVQAWEHGKALGVLDLTIEGGKITRFKGRLEEIKPEGGKEDRTTAYLVEKYNQRVDAVLNEEIGMAEVELDGENVRRRETNLGDLVSDVMRSASRADVTLINGGGIRASIKKGIIRVKDVYSVLPFDNYIVAIKLTGKQIRDALEHGVSGVEDEEGRFPQVSGLTFKYSSSQKRGSRIEAVFIVGKPIDPGREYIVATNDFLAAGGDGYRSFEEATRSSKDFSVTGGTMKGERVVYSDSGRWLRDVVVEYIKEKKKIAPKVEGRIIEVR